MFDMIYFLPLRLFLSVKSAHEWALLHLFVEVTVFMTLKFFCSKKKSNTNTNTGCIKKYIETDYWEILAKITASKIWWKLSVT